MKRDNILISILVLAIILLSLRSNTVETFLPSYDHCIKSGYTKAFCSAGPNSQLWPGQCVCRDGSIGRKLLGFRGKCICDNKPSINININKPPTIIKKDSSPIILRKSTKAPSTKAPSTKTQPQTPKKTVGNLIQNMNLNKYTVGIIIGLLFIILILLVIKRN